jgi:molybdopterin-guanine dinucleotide biosynthesis protein A
MGGTSSFAAVVLSGGTAERLGGADKGSLAWEGRALLDRVLDAVAEADEIVVAGPVVPTSRPVRFAREQPPGGGPVAGLIAARRALEQRTGLLVVVAVDMPLLTPDTVARLLTAAAGCDGAVLVDDTGRRHLAAALDVARLDAVAPPDGGHGRPWRGLLSGLALAEVRAVQDEGHDVDTWADLDRARHDETPGL